ncbi:hypothetical protein [Chryseobacterium sp. Leaf405]|uniref:hypothetical protein n=1 Tax=Chryseobacterium sp. Leaf405 TaxID=1736367 RepID=UPI0021CD7BF5|nr:hypothetical protein [Chryseobacterium sp. Leaf405]
MIDYKTEDFETKLKDYDLVLHSSRDKKVLEKSLRLIKATRNVDLPNRTTST